MVLHNREYSKPVDAVNHQINLQIKAETLKWTDLFGMYKIRFGDNAVK